MDLFNEIREQKNFFLIAGPCVVEDEDLMLQTAEKLVSEAAKRDILFIFKSSYKKANRSSIESFAGAGMQEGLAILHKIKQKFSVPILTDIHECNEIEAAAEVADVLQIPAFLSRQTELLVSAGKTNRIVNIKKGQFMAPEDIQLACEKVNSTGNMQIFVTERGSCFGYHNLVVDFRSFAILRSTQFPVVFDITHSLQKPTIGQTSGGSPEYAPMLAKAALATGMVDGIFLETHPNPAQALSDASSMLPLHTIPRLLDDLLKISSLKEN